MKSNFTSVIAISVSLTSYIPLYDCTGVPMERCNKIIEHLKRTVPEYVYSVVSSMGRKDVCEYHVNDIDWNF